MTPMVLGLGVPELLIILAVVLLLFGGSRLAGLGKSSGRALREFKQETRGLTAKEQADEAVQGSQTPDQQQFHPQSPPAAEGNTVDPEPIQHQPRDDV